MMLFAQAAMYLAFAACAVVMTLMIARRIRADIELSRAQADCARAAAESHRYLTERKKERDRDGFE